MFDQLFRRLESLLLSHLRAGRDDTRFGRHPGGEESADPTMREAWEELNDYLRGADRSGGAAGAGTEERSAGSGRSRGSGGGASPPPPDHLRQDYANLEVAFAAPFAEVRRTYKRLLGRYHPDRHAADPEKWRIATEITTRLNESYGRIAEFEKARRRGT